MWVEAYLLVIFMLVPAPSSASAPPMQYLLHQELISEKAAGADCARQAELRKGQLSFIHKGRRLAHQCLPVPLRSLT